MREEGLEAARPRRRRYSSYAGEPDGRPANAPRERAEARRAAGEAYAPDHDFSAQAPGSLAVTDVSELPACGTKLYLSPVVDCFDGLPAAWGLSRHPDSSLCDGSLAAYLDGPAGGLPADRPRRRGRALPGRELEGALLAAGRRALDVEARALRGQRPGGGFFGTLKVEFLYRRDWSRASPDEFRARARGLHGVVPRGAAQAVRGAGRDEALRDHHGPQAQAGTDGVGWSQEIVRTPRVRQNSRTCAPANAHKPEIPAPGIKPSVTAHRPTAVRLPRKDVRAREVRVAKRGNRRRASRQQKITLPCDRRPCTTCPPSVTCGSMTLSAPPSRGFSPSAENAGEMALGFVVRLDRGFPLIVTADDAFRAEHSVAFAKAGRREGRGAPPRRRRLRGGASRPRP